MDCSTRAPLPCVHLRSDSSRFADESRRRPLLCRAPMGITHHGYRCMMRYISGMRTTLEIDDDLLASAKQLARQQGLTLGQIISEIATQSLPDKSQPKQTK